MIRDENYPEDCASRLYSVWQLRNYLDRRFWATSGVREAIGFGVTNDYGEIVKTDRRPFDERG